MLYVSSPSHFVLLSCCAWKLIDWSLKFPYVSVQLYTKLIICDAFSYALLLPLLDRRHLVLFGSLL